MILSSCVPGRQESSGLYSAEVIKYSVQMKELLLANHSGEKKLQTSENVEA